LSAKGSIEDYQFEISAGLSGKDIPKGQWVIKGQGNDKRLNRVEIVGQLLEGVLKTGASKTGPTMGILHFSVYTF
jgi:hypothetical protein